MEHFNKQKNTNANKRQKAMKVKAEIFSALRFLLFLEMI
ncbi:hypothetical protein LACWKB10_0848 [Lactobacillus sp. wkB10]|nr:hypothetical protein LACWKB10_0848 [Lactobacillus sp. wkB10]